MPVNLTQQACRQSGPETACGISGPVEAGLVQLPVLFYPDLLDVRVDGLSASYHPTAYEGYLLVGLQLPSGSHDVRVRFRGLAWANWVSLVAWFGAIAAAIAAVIRVPGLSGRFRRAWPARVEGRSFASAFRRLVGAVGRQ